MKYSYTENATGITKCPNAHLCLVRYLGHSSSTGWFTHPLSLTHAFIQDIQAEGETVQWERQAHFVSIPVALTSALAMESRDGMTKISDCLVKPTKGRPGLPWMTSQNIRVAIPRKEYHMPSSSRLYFYIETICSKTGMSQGQINTRERVPTREEAPSAGGFIFLHWHFFLVKATFSWL